MEFQTTEFIASTLRSYGLNPTLFPTTGLMVDIGPEGERVAIRADIDALPIHEHEHEHDHGKTGDAHSPKQATADGHAHDHADDHTHDHDDNDHSAGHERDGDDAHSDLSAEYHFICTNIAALSQLQLSVFKHWPRIHSVDAVVVSDKGQKAARLRAKAPVLRW